MAQPISYLQQNSSRSDQYQGTSHQYQVLNSNINNLHDLPLQQSQSQSNILSSLPQDQQQQPPTSNRQNNPTLQIVQQQKIIRTLSQANRKLTQKVQHLIQSQQKQSHTKNQSIDSLHFNDQLTEMQGDVGEIQLLVKEYKEQLSKARENWAVQRAEMDQRIQYLTSQLVKHTQYLDQISQILNKKDQDIEILRLRNQELIMELESMEVQFQKQLQYQSQRSYYKKHSIHINPSYQQPFNQQISSQLQQMVKQLLKQLSFQRKTNSKMNFQIKRLNRELIESQKKIKAKNQLNYQLEMKIIHLQKDIYTKYKNGGQINQQNLRKSKDKLYFQGTFGQHKHRTFKHQAKDRYHVNDTHQVNDIMLMRKKDDKNVIKKYQQASQQKTQQGTTSQLAISPLKLKKTFSLTNPPQSNHFQSILLSEILQIPLLMKQKILLLSKLISLYRKKLISKDYSILLETQIQVYNFNLQYVQLIRVRATHAKVNNGTITLMMSNMVRIVEMVVKQVKTKDRKDLEVDLTLADVVEELLTKSHQEIISYLLKLSHSLQASVA